MKEQNNSVDVIELEQLSIKDLLRGDMFSEPMLDNILGPIAFYEVYDNHITLRKYNKMYEQLIGSVGEHIEDKIDILKYFYEHEWEKLFEMFEKAYRNRNEGASCDVYRRMEKGGYVCLKLQSFFLYEQDGRRIYYNSLRDVTKLYKQNEFLERQNKVLRSRKSDISGELLKAKEWQQVKYKILTEIPGTFVYDYEPCSDFLSVEYTMADGSVKKIEVEAFVENIESLSWMAEENIEEQKRIFLTEEDIPLSGTVDFKASIGEDERFHWYRSYYKRLLDENGKIYRIVGRADNIDDELNLVARWRERAMKDQKTKLLNCESAKKVINELLRKVKGGALLLIDVDDFKSINDMLGHLKGDEIIKNMASALKKILSQKDVAARFGGDEFMVYLPGVSERGIAVMKAKEILSGTRRIRIGENRNAECSIGIAITEDSDVTCEKMIYQADVALYKAKENGKNQYAIY